MAKPARILVLGVGNTLLRDEGLGVHAVHELLRHHEFSDNVTLLDGGTQGSRLLGPIAEHDLLIVLDAIKNGGVPGTLYQLTFDRSLAETGTHHSIHELDLIDTLMCAEWLGNRPLTVVFGLEPEQMAAFGTELSPTVAARVPELLARVVQFIQKAGGTVDDKRGA